MRCSTKLSLQAKLVALLWPNYTHNDVKMVVLASILVSRHVQRGGRRVLEHLPLCTVMPKVPFCQGNLFFFFFYFFKHPSVKACPM